MGLGLSGLGFFGGVSVRVSRNGLSATLPLLLLVAACSGGDGNDDPGAVTADEAAQLNDAAAMLDANSIDLNAATANDTDETL